MRMHFTKRWSGSSAANRGLKRAGHVTLGERHADSLRSDLHLFQGANLPFGAV